MSRPSRRFAAATLFAAVLALSAAPAPAASPRPLRTDAWAAPARQEPGLWRLLWQTLRNVWGNDLPVIDPNGKH